MHFPAAALSDDVSDDERTNNKMECDEDYVELREDVSDSEEDSHMIIAPMKWMLLTTVFIERTRQSRLR